MIAMKEEKTPELVKPWYTIKEIMGMVGVSRTTIMRYVNALNIPTQVFPVDQKTQYIAKEHVERILIIAKEPWRVEEVRLPKEQ